MGRIIAVAVLLPALAGCRSRPDVVGEWEGTANVSGQPGADPIIVQTFARTKLRIRPNGTFDLFHRGLPSNGDVLYRNSRVVLHVREIVGRPAEEVKEYEIAITGRHTATLRDVVGGGTVTLHRKAQP